MVFLIPCSPEAERKRVRPAARPENRARPQARLLPRSRRAQAAPRDKDVEAELRHRAGAMLCKEPRAEPTGRGRARRAAAQGWEVPRPPAARVVKEAHRSSATVALARRGSATRGRTPR